MIAATPLYSCAGSTARRVQWLEVALATGLTVQRLRDVGEAQRRGSINRLTQRSSDFWNRETCENPHSVDKSFAHITHATPDLI